VPRLWLGNEEIIFGFPAQAKDFSLLQSFQTISELNRMATMRLFARLNS
jgi:hypothetical protein